MNPEPWKFGRQALMFSLLMCHAWATLLIIAVFHGKVDPIISTMFSAIMLAIGWNLAIIVGGKAWKDFIPLKFGNDASGPTTVTQTQKTETTVDK